MKKYTTILFLVLFITPSFGQKLERKALKSFLEIIENIDIHLNHNETFRYDKNIDKIFFQYYTEKNLNLTKKIPIDFNERVNSKNFIEIVSDKIKSGSFKYIESDTIRTEQIKIKKLKGIVEAEIPHLNKNHKGNDIIIKLSNAIPFSDYYYFVIEIKTRNSWCLNFIYLKMNKKGKLTDWASEYGII